MQTRKIARTVTIATLLTFGCQFLAPGSQAKASHVPSKKELHNAFEIPSPRSQKFDPKRWQNEKADRWRMLFDLPHANLYGKSRKDGRALLGEPDASQTAPWGRDTNDLYKLGNWGSESVFLEVGYNESSPSRVKHTFLPDGLFCFRLMYFPNGAATSSDSEFGWITRNVSGNEAAALINENYCLVGMPASHLCQIMGHPQRVEGTKYRVNGLFQFEYTEDNTRVKRFRIYCRQPGSNTLVATKWQDRDLRPDSRCMIDATPIRETNISGIDPHFLKPIYQFSPELWQNNKRSRNWMLFDLWTTNSIIGMSQENLHSLLGEPDLVPANVRNCPSARTSGPESEEVEQNSEWFLISSPTSCAYPPSTFLQIVYEKGHVSKFRLEERGGGASELRKMPYRAWFGKGKTAPPMGPLKVAPPPEEVISEFHPQLAPPPNYSEPNLILDERYMRTGRSERTLALPGTLPPDSPIPDSK